ncbi:MAG: ORF6N domain-containing protein [Candidatus Hydrogenedentes bacterium]|nr:ORF6N domain-containing protein [Candidatus Hydrogenedentota bacterium]
MPDTTSLVPSERIERAILVIRGQKVMLDTDLAELYDVETGALLRQVKRNLDRFPQDFMFQLTNDEWEDLKCQTGISRSKWGGRRFAPYAFTEQGVAMLSSVLRSPRAVRVNVEIMRTFVRLRQMGRFLRCLSPPPGRSGKQIRRPVQGGLRCHPPTDDAARTQAQDHRLCEIGRTIAAAFHLVAETYSLPESGRWSQSVTISVFSTFVTAVSSGVEYPHTPADGTQRGGAVSLGCSRELGSRVGPISGRCLLRLTFRSHIVTNVFHRRG